MRTLIILVVGLLAVGCITPEQKALRDSVVGEYEFKNDYGDTSKLVFLENVIIEGYVNGKKQKESEAAEVAASSPSSPNSIYTRAGEA